MTSELLQSNINQLQKQTQDLAKAVHQTENVNKLTEQETIENPLSDALPLQGQLSIKDTLQIQLDKLSLQLQMLSQENQELRDDHQNLSNRLSQLQTENQVYEEDAKRLPEEREKQSAKKQEMREEIDKFNQKSKNFHQLTMTEQEACQQYKKQQFEKLAKLQAQVDILEQNQKLVTKRLQDLQKEDVDYTNIYLKNAKNDMKSMQNKIEFLNQKAVDTRRQGRKMESLVEATATVVNMMSSMQQSSQ